jgi:hypothetical protein
MIAEQAGNLRQLESSSLIGKAFGRFAARRSGLNAKKEFNIHDFHFSLGHAHPLSQK